MINSSKKLITLKEAAQISGYSADYIGQLIRSGKIDGQQVYCNIAWMTTADAVLEYKNNGKTGAQNNKFKKAFFGLKRKIAMQINVFKLFFQNFRFALPLLIILIISFALINIYLVYLFASNEIGGAGSNPPQINSSPPPETTF